MSDDLIEQLAQRLYEAYWAPSVAITGRDVFAYDKHHDAEKIAWRGVAREAIRTIEWCRRETIGIEVNLTTSGKRTSLKLLPLTLPPDGWTP